MTKLPCLAALLILGACSSIKIKSQVEKPLVEVHKLGAVSLTEKATPRLRSSEQTKQLPWRWRGRDAIGAPPQPFVAPFFINDKEAIVATVGGGLSRFDTWIGYSVWSVDVPVGVGSQVVVEGEHVFFAGLDRVLRKLKLENGEEVWTSNLSAESTGGIALGAKVLYVTAADNSLWCVDKETGRTLWTYKRPNSNRSVLWSLRGSATPVLSPDGKSLYVGFADGYVVSLDALKGTTIWEQSFERSGRFDDADTTPVLTPDAKTLFVSVVDGNFLSLNAATGAINWKLSWGSHSSPFLDFKNGYVYYSTNDGRLVKVALSTGAILWIADFTELGLGSTPIELPNGLIALTTTRFGLVILNKSNGKIVYKDPIAKGLVAAPSFRNGKLLVLSQANDLLMYKVRVNQGG